MLDVDMALADSSACLRSEAIWRQVSGMPIGEFIFLVVLVLGGPWTNLLLVASRAMGAECIVDCGVDVVDGSIEVMVLRVGWMFDRIDRLVVCVT